MRPNFVSIILEYRKEIYLWLSVPERYFHIISVKIEECSNIELPEGCKAFRIF